MFENDLPAILEFLIAKRRLNAAFLLRAICLGNIAMFSRALSALTGVPCHRVDSVLARDRRPAFAALYSKAGLPPRAFDVFACAVGAWRSAYEADGETDVERLPRIVSRAVLADYKPVGDPQVDELLVLLRRIAAETARDDARARAEQIAREESQRERLLLAAVEEAISLPPTPEELYPVADLPEDIVAIFAVYLAEEILDLEEGSRKAESEDPVMAEDAVDVVAIKPSLLLGVDPGEPGEPANDLVDGDRPEPAPLEEPDARKWDFTNRASLLEYGKTHSGGRSRAA